MNPPAVRFDGVRTVLSGQSVLRRVTLDLEPGRTTVLMGPSGAGKTTLVRHLAGLREPTDGRVFIGGQDVYDLPDATLAELRNRILVIVGGATLYEGSLFSGLTVWENVGCALRDETRPAAWVAARVSDALTDVGLAERADDLPERLSATEKRRLALARALACDAELVVVDDVDSAVDALYRDRIVAALRRRARTGPTMLLTTHDPALARAVGDRLAVLVHGRIAASGPVADLLPGIDTAEDLIRVYEQADALAPPPEPAPEQDRHRYVWLDLRVLAAVLFLIALAVALAATHGTPLPLP